MVVTVERGGCVGDGECTDKLLAEHQRAHQCGLQASRELRQAGGLEVGGRSRVDQRAPIARHPAGEALPATNRDLLNDVRISPGGEPTTERLGLVIEDEQRSATTR